MIGLSLILKIHNQNSDQPYAQQGSRHQIKTLALTNYSPIPCLSLNLTFTFTTATGCYQSYFSRTGDKESPKNRPFGETSQKYTLSLQQTNDLTFILFLNHAQGMIRLRGSRATGLLHRPRPSVQRVSASDKLETGYKTSLRHCLGDMKKADSCRNKTRNSIDCKDVTNFPFPK